MNLKMESQKVEVIEKKYVDINPESIRKIKDKRLCLVCLTGHKIEHKGFNYIVFDQNNNLKAKFIELKDAVEYAEFLSS